MQSAAVVECEKFMQTLDGFSGVVDSSRLLENVFFQRFPGHRTEEFCGLMAGVLLAGPAETQT